MTKILNSESVREIRDMTKHISPWPEQRPQRTEAERSAFAKKASEHLPKPVRDGTVISDNDLAAMKAAFAKRFNEPLPRTETLMAVAHIGYRMALRDTATEELIRGMTEMAERYTARMETASEHIDSLRAALEEIERNYANQDMNHVAFRVGAYQAAWNALNPDQKESP